MMSRAQRVKNVVTQLKRLYPLQLADTKWDNVGLLVDGGDCSVEHKDTRVLLTIDLTQSVCEEAVAGKFDIVVAYHPFIFSGIKAISMQNPQHRSLAKLLRNNISVYSPHTAVDASVNGVNDWLALGVSSNGENLESSKPVQPVNESGAGYGRLVQLKEGISLNDMVKKVKAHLWLPTVQLVKAPRHEQELIRSVAVCAGSGGSVLKGVQADLYVTGELGHHEMLYLKESGISAIVCGHSNTERGFLPALRHQLLESLNAENTNATVTISLTDADPIEYV